MGALTMATILAYSSPAAGHLFPLMPGLLELAHRGHEIHVRTHADLVDEVRGAGLHAEPVDPAILDVPVADYEAKRDIDRLRRGLHDMINRGPLERVDVRKAMLPGLNRLRAEEGLPELTSPVDHMLSAAGCSSSPATRSSTRAGTTCPRTSASSAPRAGTRPPPRLPGSTSPATRGSSSPARRTTSATRRSRRPPSRRCATSPCV
jgi:hypothetical protein